MKEKKTHETPRKKRTGMIGSLFLICGIIAFPAIMITIAKVDTTNISWYETIILYGGSIFGGLLTLFGVYITIKDNNRQRREDLGMQYMPILTEHIVPAKERNQLCSEIIYRFNHPEFCDNELDYCISQIELENVGRGEIVSCNIEVLEVSVLSSNGFKDMPEIKPEAYVLCDGAFEFIPINGKIVLFVAFPRLHIEELAERQFVGLDTTLGITIKGIIGDREYRYRLHYLLDLNIFKNNQYSNKIHTVTLMMD